MLGLLRTLANEQPELDCRLLRLDPALPTEAAVRTHHGGSRRARCRTRNRPDAKPAAFVRRLRRGLPPPDPAEPARTRLAVGRPGLLGSLHWERFAPRAPGPGEVAIAVQAAGLNFRDLMWAQGLLPEEALMAGFSGTSLGLECAGVVTAVGAGVDDLAPGMRVIAVAPASLATEVVTLRRAVIPLPDGHGHGRRGDDPGRLPDRCLCAGAPRQPRAGRAGADPCGLGSVGLAAIQYAQHRGAVVYATAGSAPRRDMLRRLGVAGVFDSRSAGFADEVMAATGGEGVDVVLNSLSGDLMESGLHVLRPFGRFIELGKRDLVRQHPAGSAPAAPQHHLFRGRC